MPGPWEKYQQQTTVPPGFRVVQPPPTDQPRFPGVPVQASPAAANVFDQFDAAPEPQAASKPRFPGVPVDAENDPWAAFPDAKTPANVFDQFDKLPPGFRVVEFEGQRVQVPNDFTDDEISSALSTLTAKPLASGKGPRVAAAPTSPAVMRRPAPRRKGTVRAKQARCFWRSTAIGLKSTAVSARCRVNSNKRRSMKLPSHCRRTDRGRSMAHRPRRKMSRR